MVDAAQEYESAKTMERQRKADEREERLSAFKGQRLTPTSPSDFHHRGISELRALVEHANPDAIENSGNHWRASADRLGGQDGRGGIRKAFMDAVDHASAHWQGSAAEAFRREALKVLDKVDRTYGHARVVERTLIGTRESGPESGVAHNLREAKKTMSGIKDPGKVDSALDDSGDDAQFHRDMANPKMDARMALELNRDSLSLSKERQVEAVIVMDELAANYESHAGILEEGTDPGGVKGDWPKHPSSSSAPPPVNMPVIGGPRPKPSSGTPKMPNGAGGSAVPEGFDGPKISRPELPVQTGLDSVQGGTLAPPTSGGSLGGGAPGGGHGVSGGTGGAFGGAIPVGGIGAPGGGAGSGARGAGGMRGGGMPGAAGGSNAARGGAAGRTGAQARTRGGMAGKPGGPMGGAKQGGSGLHRSRGGLKAGTGQGGKGMAGAPGAKGNRNEEKERTTKQRPDYLVEDEETWTPQRNVAPRVIE